MSQRACIQFSSVQLQYLCFTQSWRLR